MLFYWCTRNGRSIPLVNVNSHYYYRRTYIVHHLLLYTRQVRRLKKYVLYELQNSIKKYIYISKSGTGEIGLTGKLKK